MKILRLRISKRYKENDTKLKTHAYKQFNNTSMLWLYYIIHRCHEIVIILDCLPSKMIRFSR